MTDIEDELENSLEEAFQKTDKLFKEEERVNNEVQRKAQEAAIAARKAKFKPFGSKSKEIIAPMKTIESDNGTIKIKYVRGPDGKLKKKVKRVKVKEEEKGVSVSGLSNLSKVDDLNEKPSTRLQRVVGNDGVAAGLTGVAMHAPGFSGVTNHSDQNYSTNTNIIDVIDPVPNDPIDPNNSKNISTSNDTAVGTNVVNVKVNLPNSPTPTIQNQTTHQPTIESTSLFSDEDSSDYDPFGDDDSKKSDNPPVPSGDYFKGIGNNDNINIENIKDAISHKNILDDAIKAASETVAVDINKNTKSPIAGTFASVLATSTTYDGYDIDGDMGEEGKWVDDDDDEVEQKNKRRKRKRN